MPCKIFKGGKNNGSGTRSPVLSNKSFDAVILTRGSRGLKHKISLARVLGVFSINLKAHVAAMLCVSRMLYFPELVQELLVSPDDLYVEPIADVNGLWDFLFLLYVSRALMLILW